jgi:hypothetical protein
MAKTSQNYKEKYRNNLNENFASHEVKICDLEGFHDVSQISKNLKVTGKWVEPAGLQEIKYTKARISVHNGKNQVINVVLLKFFCTSWIS